MSTLDLILDDGVILEAVEFGREAGYTLFSRRRGQRRQRLTQLTNSQLKLIFAAMQEKGRILQDAIDELYECYHDQYDVKYRGKKLRIDFSTLFGSGYQLDYPSGLLKAA
jgi:hypothetical protein